MMTWPHNPEFPFRRHIMVAALGISVLIVLAWPGLSVGTRLGAPDGILATTVVVFGMSYIMLKLLSYLGHWVLFLFAYLMFYGGVVAVVTYPFWWRGKLAGLGDLSDLERVVSVAGTIPGMLAVSAAAYVAINRARNAA